jgi:hypothetical protein
MKTQSDQILDLVNAMNRAKASGKTDAEKAKSKAWFVLLQKIKDECDATHSETEEESLSGTKLETADILNVLAAITGWHIGTYSKNQTGEAMLLLAFVDRLSQAVAMAKGL